MCNRACIEFGQSQIRSEEVRGKRVIEVGALDVNGSLRAFVESLEPASYLGVDIQMGPGVDLVCNASDLLDRFGPQSFDLLISTELLEHTRTWRGVIHNFKQLLRPGGALLITTRSKGFPYHGYPFDYWRYEPTDMEFIFSDFSIEALQRDPLSPGVYLKTHKPESFQENSLDRHELFSILKGARSAEITLQDFKDLYRRGYPREKAQPNPARLILSFDLPEGAAIFGVQTSAGSPLLRFNLPDDLDQIAELMAAAEEGDWDRLKLVAGPAVQPLTAESQRIPDSKTAASRTDAPRISVLIPTFNRPQLLREAVDSVLQQTGKNFELIVVNDGGEDVGEMLASYQDSRIRYLHLDENGGKARALNRALDVAQGDFIAYLDDDDHYYPHHLETLLHALEANPQAELAYSDFDEVLYVKNDDGERQEIKRLLKYSHDFNRAELQKQNFIPHPTVMHRRSVLSYSGGFDESFPCLIDWEFFHRLSFYTDFHHVRQVTGEYYINREKGDHITNLHATRPEMYMEHFYRVRRRLPRRPWPKVASVSLFVRLQPEAPDFMPFLSKLLFASHHPCEIYLLGSTELNPSTSRLPDGEWLSKMNITALDMGSTEEDLCRAVEGSSGDILITLDSSFRPHNGWLSPLVLRHQKLADSAPLRLALQSEASPWGWIFDRQEFLRGFKPWLSPLPLKVESPSCQVSIIIPVRNKVDFTRKCLTSILRTRPIVEHEIIVVDNASDDGTAALLGTLQERGLLTWLRNDPPLPFAASCNRGAAAAKGNYLLFLNNDTVAFPGWLDELHQAVSGSRDIGAVGAKLLYPDEGIQHAGVAFHCFFQSPVASPYHIFRTFPRQHPAVNKVREFQAVTGACLMTPRAIFEDLGGFDERFVNCYEDIDYCLNLRSRGYRVLYVPTAELIHYEGQTPGRDDGISLSRMILQDKWGDQLKSDEHLYLPEEGFIVAENDGGVICICEEKELRQWKEAVQQLFELNEWLMTLEEVDRLEQIVGTRDPELLLIRGHCALKLGDSERARQAFEKARILKPQDANITWGLTQVAIAEQKGHEARSRLRRLITSHPDDRRVTDWRDKLAQIQTLSHDEHPLG